MKRFYREVAVAPTAAGHQVELDGRPVKTPAKRPLCAPTDALATAIAAEWRAQGEDIEPAAMPLTRLASTVLDRMPAARAAAIAELIDHAGTDLICYRADQPIDLMLRQQRVWGPLLDWFAESFGASFMVTTGIVPVTQPAPAIARVGDALAALDDWHLIGVHAASTKLGSVILGLALERGRLDAAAALQASLLDELFVVERWGEEAEAAARRRALAAELDAAATYLRSLA